MACSCLHNKNPPGFYIQFVGAKLGVETRKAIIYKPIEIILYL